MSKLNQIQTELKSVDGGKFQKLCDLYLSGQPKYANLRSIGSVLGKDKVSTGVPDSIITLSDGSYAFAHYTTIQQSVLVAKLREDLASSFEEDKTGVPVDQIKEIILCHNQSVSTEDERALRQIGQERGVVVFIYGADKISYDLFNKYPGIARDQLQIEVDTGQIVSPQAFITAYGKSSFSTPLDTRFHFREDELQKTLAALETNSIVLIAGPAGVGKSRLMLEAASRFASLHKDWSAWAILNRGTDLFQDTKIYFSPPGNYLILVDDANRLDKRFDYVLQLLHQQNEERHVKVLATVRDYARDKVREHSAQFGELGEVGVAILTDQQIRELIKEEAGIEDFYFQSRISDIAQGNPRIAMMAAAVAKEHNTLESIFDASSLYEEYFKSIQELSALQDRRIVKVAGIVSFFRTVDRTHQAQIEAISEAFNLSPADFWQAVEQLHELEVIDLYETEIAKFSDQVLSTYLFYLATFKEGVLDFSALLERFFPDYHAYFIDALTPVINSLGVRIEDQLRPHIDYRWNVLVNGGRQDELIALIQAFWFVRPVEVLRYIRDEIQAFPGEEVCVETLDFTKEDQHGRFPLLDILGAFSRTKNRSTALSLVLEALDRNKRAIGTVLRILKKDFGFKPDSTLVGFTPQTEVIEQLWARADRGKSPVFSRVFLSVAKSYLRTHFDTTQSKGMSVIITNFNLPAVPAVYALRQLIWQHLFTLFSVPALEAEVPELLRDHSRSGHLVSVKDIMVQDAQEVIPFIMSRLDPNQFKHVATVLDYLAMLDREGIEYDPHVRAKFTNEKSRLAEMLSLKQFYSTDTTYDEAQARHERELREYVQGFTPEDYEQLLSQCVLIVSETPQSNQWDTRQGIEKIFDFLGESEGEVFTEVVLRYLKMGNPLNVYGGKIILDLIRFNGADATYKLLVEEEFPNKAAWLFGLFASIPPEEVSPAHLASLYELYRTAPANELPVRYDFLERYKHLDDRVVAWVIETILSRAQEEGNSDFIFKLTYLFNPHLMPPEKLVVLFNQNVDLLKQVYLAAQMVNDHADFDGQAFSAILDLDLGFLREYIRAAIEAAKGEGKRWISSFDNSKEFLFLWGRDDYETIMRDAVLFLYSVKQQEEMYVDLYLESMFGTSRPEKVKGDILEKQAHLLSRFITERGSDGEFMAFIFSTTSKLSEDNRRELIALFLSHNKKPEEFQRIPLLPSSGAWYGSAVPYYQKELDFLESLLPLVEGLDFLDHRFYLEERIRGFQKVIEQEKRRDFTRGV